jgi:nucleoside-diphosphate-sugar epimerase
VRKLIFISSGAVYGAHPDNDVPLRETSPVRPARDNAYATAKAEAERIVRSFVGSYPDVVVTVLRPAWVLGPGLPARMAGIVEAPVRLAAAGYEVPLQAVHESDAGRAILHVLDGDFPGTFNVCADDAVDDPEALLGQRKLTVGLEQAERFRDVAVRTGLLPLGDLGALKYPEVMSNELLKETGFVPEYSSADALRAAAEARRGWIAIGPVRFRPRWALVAAASVAALAVGSAARAASVRRARS